MTGRVSAVALDARDNVLCLLRDHAAGETPVLADGEATALSTDVRLGHKIARGPIGKGENVIKYGAAIGVATQDIAIGEHVHLHNLRGRLGGTGGQ